METAVMVIGGNDNLEQGTR